uniref:SH3 domain-containing protein n=1 Tax=Aegilops tauschii subsp. strangulata TaxID=200361 RepID=A0A453IFD4_AEGTS
MLNARPHEESDNNDDVPSSDPSSEPKVSSPKVSPTHVHSNSISEDPALTETSEPTRNGQEVHYVGEVIHPFDGQADGELSISVGDFVVVRQVCLQTDGRKGSAKERQAGSHLRT